MRFAPSQLAEGAHGHVHFDEKLHDSAVMVTQDKDGSFLVKVGTWGNQEEGPLAALACPCSQQWGWVCACGSVEWVDLSRAARL